MRETVVAGRARLAAGDSRHHAYKAALGTNPARNVALALELHRHKVYQAVGRA